MGGMQPGPLLSKSVKDVVTMNNRQRFCLALVLIIIAGGLIATGNTTGARELVFLASGVVGMLCPWERFRYRHPDKASEKGMTSRAPTRHPNRYS